MKYIIKWSQALGKKKIQTSLEQLRPQRTPIKGIYLMVWWCFHCYSPDSVPEWGLWTMGMWTTNACVIWLSTSTSRNLCWRYSHAYRMLYTQGHSLWQCLNFKRQGTTKLSIESVVWLKKCMRTLCNDMEKF